MASDVADMALVPGQHRDGAILAHVRRGGRAEGTDLHGLLTLDTAALFVLGGAWAAARAPC